MGVHGLMCKIFIALLIIVCLSGCGIFNLNYFIMPDDLEFIAVVESLDTPEKICQYMRENFEHVITFFAYSPYQMWLLNTQTKYGDCNDYSTWAIFVANYHGYETYQICVDADYGGGWKHTLGVFVEDVEGRYSYSSNDEHYNIHANTFKEIVDHHIKRRGIKLNNYKVYDYNMKLIERGTNG